MIKIALVFKMSILLPFHVSLNVAFAQIVSIKSAAYCLIEHDETHLNSHNLWINPSSLRVFKTISDQDPAIFKPHRLQLVKFQHLFEI